jgi:hypothetical protein
MGLGCNEDQRQKHGRWCSLLDGIIGATWASSPDPGGAVAVGTAALDPEVPTAAISASVHFYNNEMAKQGKFENIIDTTWAGQHPMEAHKELNRRGWSLKK